MWRTSSTDLFHNMFGCPIARTPLDTDKHDPYVLFKSPKFDVVKYQTISSIKIMEMGPSRAMELVHECQGRDIMDLAPDQAERFLRKFLGKEVTLQGIERAYDYILEIHYHTFYYVD